MRLYSLFGDCFGDSLGVSPFELPGQQISQPPLEQGGHPSHEKHPRPPRRPPDSAAGPLANWAGVKPVVNYVLQIG